MFQVTITECYGERKVHVSKHKNASTAEPEAIQKAYGKGKFLCVDNGISTGSVRYGQVGHYMERKTGLISTDTGRVRVEVEELK